MNAKMVYSVYNHDFPEVFNPDFARKVKMAGMTKGDLQLLQKPDFVNLNLSAMKFSDAIIQGSDKIHPDLMTAFNKTSVPTLGYHNVDEYIKAYAKFYDEILTQEELVTE